jgi:hypothetical protein
MSDLLTSLAARSVGVAEGIQPRVPSLFEPHRQDEGMFGDRRKVGEIDPESPREDDSTARDIARETVPRDRVERPPEPDLPPRRDRAPSIAELLWEEMAGRAFPPKTSADSSRPSPLEGEPARQPGGAKRGGLVPPPSLDREAPRPLLGAARAAENPREPPVRERDAGEGVAAPSSAGVRPSQSLRPATSVPNRTADAAGVQSGQSAPRLPPLSARIQRIDDPRFSPTQAKPVPAMDLEKKTQRNESREFNPAIETSLVRPPATVPARGPSALKPGASIRPASAKETAPLSDGVANPPRATPLANSNRRSVATPAVSELSEPSIRVTIGRVDVRAVFPPAPASRPPVQRGRPTLSLDEYLKRSGGAGR